MTRYEIKQKTISIISMINGAIERGNRAIESGVVRRIRRDEEVFLQ